MAMKLTFGLMTFGGIIQATLRSSSCDPQEENCYTMLEERIKVLEDAWDSSSLEGLYSIVDHKNEYLTAYQQEVIRLKALFLINAYKFALKRLGHTIEEDELKDDSKEVQKYRWIDHCCLPAVQQLNAVGIRTTTNKQVLGRWSKVQPSSNGF